MKQEIFCIFFFILIFFNIFNSHLGNDFGIQGIQFGQMLASINSQNFVEKIKKKKYFPKKNCQKNNFLFLVKNHVKSLPDLHFFDPLKKPPKKRRQQSRIKQNHLHFQSFSLLCSKHQKRINFGKKKFYVPKLVGYSWCFVPILLKSRRAYLPDLQAKF